MKASELTKRINWIPVLEIDRHIFDSLTTKPRIIQLISAIKVVFMQRPNIDKKYRNTDFLFFKSMKRDDYDELFQSISEQCTTSNNLIDLANKKMFWPRLYPVFIAIKYWKTLISTSNKNIFKSIYLIVRLLHYLEVYERVNKYSCFKNLVVFADMQPIDNLLIQAARLDGVKTVTLQHGLYIDYSSYPNINSVNYTNASADFFLAWGKSTRDLINKYHPNIKIYICGKPIKQVEFDEDNNNFFTVLFDQNLLRTYNASMLKIAYELQEITNLTVNLRFHPRNNPKSYRLRATTLVNQSIEGSKFIIAHTTSMIHEIMRLGKAVYKFETNIPSINTPSVLTFSSCSDLITKIESHNHDPDYFREYAKEHILYIGHDSLEQYRLFFEMLNEH